MDVDPTEALRLLREWQDATERYKNYPPYDYGPVKNARQAFWDYVGGTRGA